MPPQLPRPKRPWCSSWLDAAAPQNNTIGTTVSAVEVAAFVGLPDGSTWIRDALTGDAGDPAGLGREVAERLLAAGAREVLDAAESI